MKNNHDMILKTEFGYIEAIIMNYEVTIEDMTPCGGEKYAMRRIVEVEAESPMAYVQANKRFPNVEAFVNADGDTVIVASNAVGYRTRYTFTE